jgi:hypothetical protein
MNNDKKFVLVVFVAKSIKKIFKVNRKKKKTVYTATTYLNELIICFLISKNLTMITYEMIISKKKKNYSLIKNYIYIAED